MAINPHFSHPHHTFCPYKAGNPTANHRTRQSEHATKCIRDREQLPPPPPSHFQFTNTLIHSPIHHLQRIIIIIIHTHTCVEVVVVVVRMRRGSGGPRGESGARACLKGMDGSGTLVIGGVEGRVGR